MLFLKRNLFHFLSINKILSMGVATIQTKSIQVLLDDKTLLKSDKETIRVIGWVKGVRDRKQMKFIHLNDGSDARNLQLVFINSTEDIEKHFKRIYFNTAIEVTGNLVASDHQKHQSVEFKVNTLQIICECQPSGNNNSSYPFQLNKVYNNFADLRPFPHLRTHISLFASVLRLRATLTRCIDQVMHDNHILHVHTPILTTNNCEGGSTAFQATVAIKEKQRNYFNLSVFLTCSAQLHLEALTTGLGNVYTMNATFRADKSQTRHHLAEFYMLEVELIDMEHLDQLLDMTELLVKNLCHRVLLKCNQADLKSITNDQYLNSIQKCLEKKFIRVDYKEVLSILSKKSGKEIPFGQDLNKEQEKWVCDHFQGQPVFICRYPKKLKPFYMRQCDQDPDLVENFDLLMPHVGEIVGGSLREYRADLMLNALKKQCEQEDSAVYKQYLESKCQGGMRTGGFGLGLERLMQFLLNIENIRDTIPFPRFEYSCSM